MLAFVSRLGGATSPTWQAAPTRKFPFPQQTRPLRMPLLALAMLPLALGTEADNAGAKHPCHRSHNIDWRMKPRERVLLDP